MNSAERHKISHLWMEFQFSFSRLETSACKRHSFSKNVRSRKLSVKNYKKTSAVLDEPVADKVQSQLPKDPARPAACEDLLVINVVAINTQHPFSLK